MENIKVLTELETVDKLLEGYSIARYGDGEMVVCQKKNIGFQSYNMELAESLKNLANAKLTHPKLIIAIPPQIFGNTSNYTDVCNKYWISFAASQTSKFFINNILDKNIIYGSSFITRLSELVNGKIILNKIRTIWQDKNVVYLISDRNKKKWNQKLKIMFSNAKTINFISIPHRNAWDIKDNIINNIAKNYDNNHIILCSCGPTATVLAYEFTSRNYQCIDLGHFVEIANVADIKGT